MIKLFFWLPHDYVLLQSYKLDDEKIRIKTIEEVAKQYSYFERNEIRKPKIKTLSRNYFFSIFILGFILNFLLFKFHSFDCSKFFHLFYS